MALTPEQPPAGPPLVTRTDVVRGALLAAGVALLGAPVGLLWASVTPRAELVRFDNGGLGLADVEDKAFIATDATFVLLTLAVGLLVGVLAWLLGHRWAPGAVVGAVVGAALAAVVALETGQVFDARLGSFADSTRSPAEGVPLTLPNELLKASEHSWGLVLAWPAGAALGFAAMAIWRIGPPETVAGARHLSSGRRSSSRSREWARPAGRAAGPPPA